ncbi:cytochrome c oxidase subunit 5B, mitochondrial-like [Oratosquilla oratoria]|uniref:cytochrome c oxidase subunit 5B, mitochondrial-like n=1 Tax=Oratosquilla oratoria TaxID=337810 RepID=UPI003F764300
MARTVARNARVGVQVTTVRYANKMMADSLEHATGLEKQELLSKAAGNENPFDMRVSKRVSGDSSNPTTVPSFYASRLVGCICEEDATCVNWMWLRRADGQGWLLLIGPQLLGLGSGPRM